jgi:nicotinate-nucleotide adenylyltransferase
VLVFGGTFDPPHLAHARLPALAAQQLKCDEILYIPAAINPLKSDTKPAPKEHRVAMLLLAIADVPGAKISTIELDRQGKSYTIDTLRALHEAYSSQARVSAAQRRGRSPQASGPKPQAAFHLLIGCDQALDFRRWKQWQEILTLATPAVMLRPPWTPKKLAEALKSKHSAAEAERWLSWTLNLPLIDINATEIRQRLSNGASVDGMLAPAVAEYIRVNGLYQ